MKRPSDSDSSPALNGQRSPYRTSQNKAQLPRALWTSACLLVLIWGWSVTDPSFPNLTDELSLRFTTRMAWPEDIADRPTSDDAGNEHSIRVAVAMSAACVAIVTLGWSAFSFSRKASRVTLGHLLALTAVTACWFGFLAQQDAFAWQSKRLRMLMVRQKLQPIAEQLTNRWPDVDGELESIGPFMAYPQPGPTVLLLLAPPETRGGTTIASIERSAEGGLRFQLTGDDGGDWIEWHPPGVQPNDFRGGLESRHVLHQYLPLGSGWYLVSYQA